MVVHATGESLSQPHGPGTYAVVLGGSELALQALASKLDAAGIPHKTVVESDPPWLGQVMAVGISPNTRISVSRNVVNMAVASGES